jgi:hypothetical protein
LLSDSLVVIAKPGLVKALGAAPASGLAKEGPIDFRVDLPPGVYAIEIMMDGGSLETWTGEISVDGNILTTRLTSFGFAAESGYAPPYWTCLRTFRSASDHSVLRVHAKGQRTTITSVSVFPYSEGPLTYVNGIFFRTATAGAPNFDLALKLINAGKVTEATRIIDALPSEWNIDRAHLLLALASKLETQTPRQFVETAYGILSTEYVRSRNESLRLYLRLAELYLRADQHYKQAGWEWAKEYNGMGIFGNCEISGMSASAVASIPGNPLWFASVWHLAKTCYWLWVEQHVHQMMVTADSLFNLTLSIVCLQSQMDRFSVLLRGGLSNGL